MNTPGQKNSKNAFPRLERDWRNELDTLTYYRDDFQQDKPAQGRRIAQEEQFKAKYRDISTLHNKLTIQEELPESFNLQDDTGIDQKHGAPNYNEAFYLEHLRQQRLASAFAAIVSKIAEDLGGWAVEGDDEWSVPALMRRRITRESISTCRQSREKESLVVILDTSGSCLPQARFYSKIATIAVKTGDVELYAAPNAGIHAKRTAHGWVGLKTKHWPFKRRIIVFFGDFDGGDQVVESSWHNKIYWFSSEGRRYPSMVQHPWCSYNMNHLNGKYFICNKEDDIIKLTKKIN